MKTRIVSVHHEDTKEVRIDYVIYYLEVNAVDDRCDDNGIVSIEWSDVEETDVTRMDSTS